MIIKMLKTDFTTKDNFILCKFEEGKYYNVRESTGCRLVQRGAADVYTPIEGDEVKDVY